MDEASVKKDFARFKATIESLAPVFSDILKHFDGVAAQHFNKDRQCLLDEVDEKYLSDALNKNCAPVVAFVGRSNAGKSSLLNVILEKDHRVLPEKQHPCTARVVRLRHSRDFPGNQHRRQTWCLLDKHGKRDGEPRPFEKRIPSKSIDLQGEDREGEEIQQAVEGEVESGGLLSYGVELVDTPGLGESSVFGDLLKRAVANDIRPLIVYVLNGYEYYKLEDGKNLNELKRNYPTAEFIFVVNKSDLKEKNVEMDLASDDDEEEEAAKEDVGEPWNRSHFLRKFKALEINMMKLKARGFLDHDEVFGESEKFHCLSARLVRKARSKMKAGQELSESETYFLDTYKRFHGCLLKRLHTIMSDLEAGVRLRIRNVLESFLTTLGRSRVDIRMALRDMGTFITNAQRAENHLHDSQRFHKIFDKILTGDDVVLHALNAAKVAVKSDGLPVNDWDLESIRNDTKGKFWLSRFGMPEDRPRDSQDVRENHAARLRAVSFVIEAEGAIVTTVTNFVLKRIEDAIAANAGDFLAIINDTRSSSVDVLNGLFDQAYRVRHSETDGGFDGGVSKMRSIVRWTPIEEMVRETMDGYSEHVLKDTKASGSWQTNFKQWRAEFVDMAFDQFCAEEISAKLREGCYQCLDDMHKEFMKITSRVKDLRDTVKGKGKENIERMEAEVKPMLLLHMCEVDSIEFQRDEDKLFTAGRQIGQNGQFSIHDCPERGDWVVYVARKCDLRWEKEWLKVTGHVFHANEMSKRIPRPHPNLVNCHGFWMPDRDSFYVAFDRTDTSLVEYLKQKDLTLRARLVIALKLARVLADVHTQAQSSHLDLRLSNIMMLDDEPRLLHCCPKSPLDPISVEIDGQPTEMPPFHLHPDFTARERTDAAAYMDRYAYGMLLWVLVTGSPTAYPKVFAAYDDIKRLSGASQVRDTAILPEEPQAAQGEESLVKKLYELMKLVWTECKELTMGHIADHLEYLLGLRKDSFLFQCYPSSFTAEIYQ